ncbi:hypothetical protein FDG2_1915 [Candidatus Protofrankia californiensis]|uniref:Helix-turn-helix domain-containing protein n=1 Tax=Candidatus Protofrankia californiensis TaxID=1839754 RepID=A0A1C3NWQ0_9ACTN|nr:hypothetical protein FDG2_1915 [Candidatus Protofrankia californiensis]
MSAVTVEVGMGQPVVPIQSDGPSEHPLMTVPEAAKALRVSEMTVRRAIHANEIPYVKIGRAYRVPRSYITGVLTVTETRPALAAPNAERAGESGGHESGGQR